MGVTAARTAPPSKRVPHHPSRSFRSFVHPQTDPSLSGPQHKSTLCAHGVVSASGTRYLGGGPSGNGEVSRRAGQVDERMAGRGAGGASCGAWGGGPTTAPSSPHSHPVARAGCCPHPGLSVPICVMGLPGLLWCQRGGVSAGQGWSQAIPGQVAVGSWVPHLRPAWPQPGSPNSLSEAAVEPSDGDTEARRGERAHRGSGSAAWVRLDMAPGLSSLPCRVASGTIHSPRSGKAAVQDPTDATGTDGQMGI